MHVKRFAAAEPYEAPNHQACTSLRLAGFAAGGPKNFWIGLSHFLPGGGAGPDASPLEITRRNPEPAPHSVCSRKARNIEGTKCNVVTRRRTIASSRYRGSRCFPGGATTRTAPNSNGQKNSQAETSKP